MFRDLLLQENDIDRFLFHYTTRTIFFEKILLSHSISLGQIKYTNDPRETQRWTLKPVAKTVELYEEELDSENACVFFHDGLENRLKLGTRILCMTRDQISTDRRMWSRGFNHPRMWSQYAANHTGVCLVFDRKILTRHLQTSLNASGDLYLGDVDYTNDPLDDGFSFSFDYDEYLKVGLEHAARIHVARHYRRFFFHKAKDWSAEMEYRYVFHGPGASPLFIDFSDCLVGIILGDAFPYSELDAAYSQCQTQHIPTGRIIWGDGMPMLY